METQQWWIIEWFDLFPGLQCLLSGVCRKFQFGKNTYILFATTREPIYPNHSFIQLFSTLFQLNPLQKIKSICIMQNFFISSYLSSRLSPRCCATFSLTSLGSSLVHIRLGIYKELGLKPLWGGPRWISFKRNTKRNAWKTPCFWGSGHI